MARRKDDFVHLHLHSDRSQLDGCGKLVDFVRVAAERGNPALAFTEHGTMRGAYDFVEAVKEGEHDLKPIFGIEFYVSQDMRRRGLTPEDKEQVTKGLKKSEHKTAIKNLEDELGIRDRWHLTVWALDDEGLRNLYRLSSAAFIEGFYYKPRIDINELVKYGAGLAVATGCVSSPINDNWNRGKKRKALDIFETLYGVFGDRLYLEIQPHILSDGSQTQANKLQFGLRKQYPDLKLIATQDAHYIHRDDADHHEVLLCIGTGSVMSNPNRFKFDGDQFWMKTRAEMQEALEDNHGYLGSKFIKEALNSTIEVSERATAKIVIDPFRALMPPVDISSDYKGTEFEFLRDLCVKGMAWRDIPSRARRYAASKGISHSAAMKVYSERLKYELRALRNQKFVPYFLIVRDLYEWARGEKIAVGPGRGSAAGSIVSFLLGITVPDPIEHGLIFERFINPDRIDMPDIDMDFEDVRREEVIQHLRELYGDDKVCQIATLSKLSGKQCIKDVSRVLEVPYAEVNQITNSIIERSSGDERASQTIEDSFKDFKVCREFDEKYPDVLYHARHLEGMTKGLGIHAAGVVAAPMELTDLIPLEIRKHAGRDVIVSAYDMYGVAGMGLLKLDVLGLRTLTVLRECREAILERYGDDIDLEKLDLNDPQTLQGFTDHDYAGVFQYDTPGADKICAGVEFVHFDDIAAMTALNRPGTARSGLATEYVARKKDPTLVEQTQFHPKVSEITADTLGIIVYQEHIIRIFTEIAGFAPGTSDSLRKKIAKKMGDESIGKERENFIKGAVKNTPGMDKKTAGKIMDSITFFGSYGFNRSHAVSYGIIAYWGMYLKLRYPLEFYWALLKNEPDRIRIQRYVKAARGHDTEVLQPDVNVSGVQFTIDHKREAIRGSLVDIKNVGAAASQSIIETQPFAGYADFCRRVNRRRVNKRVVDSLAKAGALDSIVPNVRWLVENMEDVWKQVGKGAWERVDEMMAESESAERWSADERVLQASSVNPLAFGKHPMDAWGELLGAQLGIEITRMDGEDFWKQRHVWIAGIMVERKYNQVGDFNTGALPDEEERERMKWGSRYANINIEDASGIQNRTKVDWDIFDDVREVVDSGIGTPVLAFVTLNPRYQNMRSHVLISIQRLYEKLKAGDDLTRFEQIACGQHPALTFKWKTDELRSSARQDIEMLAKTSSQDGFRATGVVTNIKSKKDRKGNEMAWIGLLGVQGFIEVLCFGSSWPTYREHLKPGLLVTMDLEKLKGGGASLDDRWGRIRIHRARAKKAAVA